MDYTMPGGWGGGEGGEAGRVVDGGGRVREWRMAGGEWRGASGEWRVTSGGWRVADGGWRMAGSGWWFGKTLLCYAHEGFPPWCTNASTAAPATHPHPRPGSHHNQPTANPCSGTQVHPPQYDRCFVGGSILAHPLLHCFQKLVKNHFFTQTMFVRVFEG
ncbi:MAG: hypothetical protein ABIG63_20020, partial [Chloroflexota bacterium]